MKRTCDVAAGLEDGSDRTFNTIVVPTRDLIVTIERDPSDPKQADRAVLRSAGGGWVSETVALGSEGAEEKNGRIVVRFTDVPHGAHRVCVDVGDGPKDLIHDIVGRQAGVFAGGKKLGSAPPTKELPGEIELVEETFPEERDPRIQGDQVGPASPEAERALLANPPGASADKTEGGAR